MELSGVLLIDKPVGPTSFDVVRRVRRALKIKRAGHTGTLDPAATGLLPVCLGDATRIATFLTSDDKEYVGTIRFGITTDTLDAQGTVTATADTSHLTREAIEQVARDMIGVRQQAAPMYSARRVDGRRLHELAREGVEVEREAREIVIEALEVLDVSLPEATVRVRCSKGTYIRVIAEDFGRALGCGAHLSALRRTASGGFSVADAVPLEALEQDPSLGESRLLSVERALESLPALQLDARHSTSVAFGNPVDLEMQQRLGLAAPPAGQVVRILDPRGLVVAVGEADTRGIVRLLRVLRAQTGKGPRCG